MLLASITLIIITLTACSKPRPETVVEPEGPPDIRNPAEVYCTELGYEYTIRERKIVKKKPQPETPVEPTPETLEGPYPSIPVIPDYLLEVVCIFPNGTECEEWEFMMGSCGQEYSYCVQQGYSLEPSVNGATCVFPDGSSCLEFDHFNGDCTPGERGELSE
jgi:putative hemolysin